MVTGIINRDMRFYKIGDKWIPSTDGGGELFLRGETIEVPDRYAEDVGLTIETIKPTDFKMMDKQVTTSHTKAIKKKVKRKKLKYITS